MTPRSMSWLQAWRRVRAGPAAPPKSREAQRSCQILEEWPLVSYHLVTWCCCWSLKDKRNSKMLWGVAKWWKQMGPRRRKLNRWILIDVVISAGREEDVENALKEFSPVWKVWKIMSGEGFLQWDRQPADRGTLITWNLSRDAHLPSHCPAKTIKCVNWPPGSWPVVLKKEDR